MIKKYQKAFTLTEISMVFLVIGILIAGISQAIEMFSEASLKSARNLSKSSRISRIDDLSLWLDATSDKAFDKEKDDGSTISMWKDTNPRSTAQIIGNPVSSMPTYTLSAINGLPTASFKKTSSNCMTIPSQSFVNNSEDFTLYLIFSPTTLDDGIILEKNNATATAFPFSLELLSGSYKFSIKNSANTISVTSPKKANINNPNLISLSRIKGSQIEIVIDGVSATQSDTLTSSTLNNAELAIGCRNGATPPNFVSGDFGETAFFNRNLSVKEKTDIEEYLYKKWKMKKFEGTLPAITTPAPAIVKTCSLAGGAGYSAKSELPVGSASFPCDAGYAGTINYNCPSNGGTATISGGSSCTESPIKCYAIDMLGFRGTHYFDNVSFSDSETMYFSSYNVYILNSFISEPGLVNRFKLYDVYHGQLIYILTSNNWRVFKKIDMSNFSKTSYPSYFRYAPYPIYVSGAHQVTKYARILGYGTNTFNCDSGFTGTLTYNCTVDGSTLNPSSGGCSAN